MLVFIVCSIFVHPRPPFSEWTNSNAFYYSKFDRLKVIFCLKKTLVQFTHRFAPITSIPKDLGKWLGAPSAHVPVGDTGVSRPISKSAAVAPLVFMQRPWHSANPRPAKFFGSLHGAPRIWRQFHYHTPPTPNFKIVDHWQCSGSGLSSVFFSSLFVGPFNSRRRPDFQTPISRSFSTFFSVFRNKWQKLLISTVFDC